MCYSFWSMQDRKCVNLFCVVPKMGKRHTCNGATRVGGSCCVNTRAICASWGHDGNSSSVRGKLGFDFVGQEQHVRSNAGKRRSKREGTWEFHGPIPWTGPKAFVWGPRPSGTCMPTCFEHLTHVLSTSERAKGSQERRQKQVRTGQIDANFFCNVYSFACPPPNPLCTTMCFLPSLNVLPSSS